MYKSEYIFWDKFRNNQSPTHNVPVLIKIEDLLKADEPFSLDLRPYYDCYCHGNYESLAIALVRCGEFGRQRIADKMK